MNHVDRGKKHVFGEINITPLTDIFLVLLIIVIVVAPYISNSRGDIKMPRLTAGDALDKKWLTVEITSDGTLYMDANPVKPEELTDLLRGRLAASKDKFLVVRGDRASKSRVVMTVFESAKAAGYERVMVAGESDEGASAPTAEPAPPPAPPLQEGA